MVFYSFLHNLLKNMSYIYMQWPCFHLQIPFVLGLQLCYSYYAGYPSFIFVQFVCDFQLFVWLCSFQNLLRILQLLFSLFFFIWVEESFARFWWKVFQLWVKLIYWCILISGWFSSFLTSLLFLKIKFKRKKKKMLDKFLSSHASFSSCWEHY